MDDEYTFVLLDHYHYFLMILTNLDFSQLFYE